MLAIGMPSILAGSQYANCAQGTGTHMKVFLVLCRLVKVHLESCSNSTARHVGQRRQLRLAQTSQAALEYFFEVSKAEAIV